MKKLFFMLFSATILILLSCGLAKIGDKGIEIDDPISESNIVFGSTPRNQTESESSEIKKPKPAERPVPRDPQPSNPSNNEPITQWDSETLDRLVIEEAQRFKKDPKTYRKHVRTEADGTQVFRMLGTHVIVNPNKEEIFLPDEI